jgi:hypothetical protein
MQLTQQQLQLYCRWQDAHITGPAAVNCQPDAYVLCCLCVLHMMSSIAKTVPLHPAHLLQQGCPQPQPPAEAMVPSGCQVQHSSRGVAPAEQRLAAGLQLRGAQACCRHQQLHTPSPALRRQCIKDAVHTGGPAGAAAAASGQQCRQQ